MKNFTNKVTVSFILAFLVGLITFSSLNAQETKFRDQAWRFGINAGVQFNSLSLGYQNLHTPYPNFTSANGPKDNSDGKGLGLYGGLFGEYLSDSWWGIQLRASYDVRDGLIKDTTTGPPSGRLKGVAFDAKMNYLSWELLLRVDQNLIPNLSIVFGPILAINIHGTYDYKPDVNSEAVSETNVKIANRNDVPYGITGGLAYDIELSRSQKTSMYLSPFVDASWIVNQKKTDYPEQNSVTDVWSTLSLRLGARLSWEFRNPVEEKVTRVEYIQPAPQKVVEAYTGKKVSVIMPTDNTILTKNVKGYYPILPYVFFDKDSKEIPSRYIMLSRADAQNFNETDLGNFSKGEMTVKETNVNELMVTYYNVMNIYGDRMRKNPDEKLVLVGCDPEEKDGEVCANKVKNYLVNNYGIDADRISIKVEAPRKPSGSALTDPAFSGLINDENRRVGFVFTNENMYKPIPYTIRDESSIDNDMVFAISDNVPYKSWNITITGENQTMNFGPFTTNRERVNPAPLMRGLDNGRYNAKVVVTTKDGKEYTEDVDFKLTKSKEIKNASRYLMIFDYNKSDPVLTYETKIRKEITPGMNEGNTVIIHGHTDIIGNEAGNQKLSQERSDQAKRIVDDQLGKENKKIAVQSIGTGQTKMQYTFENRYPEGRMYNRNVFVEVIQ
ncbi:MAG: OmpA family protein [Bacteroidota bacterium]